MAERVGFEPTLEFPLNTLSKRAPSTTRPSLQLALLRAFYSITCVARSTPPGLKYQSEPSPDFAARPAALFRCRRGLQPAQSPTLPRVLLRRPSGLSLRRRRPSPPPVPPPPRSPPAPPPPPGPPPAPNPPRPTPPPPPMAPFTRSKPAC